MILNQMVIIKIQFPPAPPIKGSIRAHKDQKSLYFQRDTGFFMPVKS